MDEDMFVFCGFAICMFFVYRLYEPKGYYREKGSKMCVTRVIGGFRGVNPGFTHFGGLGPVLGGRLV
jgi:hypothetical protein